MHRKLRYKVKMYACSQDRCQDIMLRHRKVTIKVYDIKFLRYKVKISGHIIRSRYENRLQG